MVRQIAARNYEITDPRPVSDSTLRIANVTETADKELYAVEDAAAAHPQRLPTHV